MWTRGQSSAASRRTTLPHESTQLDLDLTTMTPGDKNSVRQTSAVYVLGVEANEVETQPESGLGSRIKCGGDAVANLDSGVAEEKVSTPCEDRSREVVQSNMSRTVGCTKCVNPSRLSYIAPPPRRICSTRTLANAGIRMLSEQASVLSSRK